MKNENPAAISLASQNFDRLPDDALVGLPEYKQLTQRGRSSFYRDIEKGHLDLVRIGRSIRVRVGSLRRLMGITQH